MEHKKKHKVNGMTKWWVLIAIGISTFMSALDGSVVNTILPIIQGEINSSVAEIEWVVTIYLLVLSGLLLSFGRLGDIRGHKSIFLSGFVVFLLGSALCGMAKVISTLIIFRGIQAFGAAMIQANSPAILTKTFPSDQRGKALGLQATMTYLGLIVGPSFGGWLAELFGWQIVFYINIPIGLFTLWLSTRFIAPDHVTKTSEHFDIPGAVTFMAGLIMLLLALNLGHNQGWTSPLILILFCLAILLIVIFIRHEQNAVNPMLDLSLFKNRIFSTAAAGAVLNYICVYSVIFLMPFYLLRGRNLSPSQTGLILMSMPVIMAIVAPISGTLSDRIGTKAPTVLGMVLIAIGLGLLATLNATTPLIQIIFNLACVGLGIGIFISPNNSALMGSAPKKRQGIAAGIMATARNLGMVIGVGISGAIFTTFLDQQEIHSEAIFIAIQVSFWVSVSIAIIGVFVTAFLGKPISQDLSQKRINP